MLYKALLLFVMLMLALAGCSGEIEPGPDGSTAKDKGAGNPDQTVQPDTAAPDTGSGGCSPEGDKRCDGLLKIEICKNGKWTPHEDCSQKKRGGQQCTCSITMLYVCAVGMNVCT